MFCDEFNWNEPGPIVEEKNLNVKKSVHNLVIICMLKNKGVVH